jgi:hypothetical protein
MSIRKSCQKLNGILEMAIHTEDMRVPTQLEAKTSSILPVFGSILLTEDAVP